jgi:hypothetical protein
MPTGIFAYELFQNTETDIFVIITKGETKTHYLDLK